MLAAALPASAIATTSAPGIVNPQGGVCQNINARQNRNEVRINQGIRSGALTRREAVRLRTQFRAIERLEARYRLARPGLTLAKRRDLDRRFDSLERSIRIQKHDRDHRGRRW
ncbi:hypothetical protein [Sphingomonas sp. S2-65]|uniref:hypothetical protein n=1 Tax=Sphingomonas sp. S2-65 TaxID=2903960 RepID=UPI001F269264|nr:hypothetical protein [Sphingomonas sp. S2-65]UYY57185.1 hypothetical protein LZ586_10850 [Sphingomonas sp. S2-65]